MITDSQWNSFLHLSPGDFQYPAGLQFSIVSALDRFIGQIGSKPEIISDYREGDPRQHGKGLAIDTAWPGQNPLEVNQAALDSHLFSGVGIYVNPAGVASHHFDTRVERSVDAPARWGGVIEHPVQADGSVGKAIEYTTMQAVIDQIKKNLGGTTNVVAMVLIGIGLWLILRSGHSS